MEMGNSVSSIPCLDRQPESSPEEPVRHNALLDVDHNSHHHSNSNGGPLPQSNHVTMKKKKNDDDSIPRKFTQAIQKFFQHFEKLMFPKSLLLNYNINSEHPTPSRSHNSRDYSNRTTTLLRRYASFTEQQADLPKWLASCQHLHGKEGLQALGFEYRLVYCDEHKFNTNHNNSINDDNNNIDDDDDDDDGLDAVDSVPSVDDDNNVRDTTTTMYLSERTLRRVATLDLHPDHHFEHDHVTLEQPEEEGQVTLVELAQVKSERFLSLSNRSHSILSEDGDASSHDDHLVGGSHLADICTTTPSLATTFTAAMPPYDDEDVNDPVVGHDRIHTAPTTGPPAEHTQTTPPNVIYKDPTKQIVHHFCHLCERRLYDMESNTCITDQNRTEFIANGDMYEFVSQFVQEYAHEIMMEEGNLIWTDIDEHDNDEDGNDDTCHGTSAAAAAHETKGMAPAPTNGPIRCLISKDHPCLLRRNSSNSDNKNHHRPTILICTGRGKVRAGIFSRHHLICTGLERSTALPYIHEAIHRNIHVIIVDPNVHGEIHGFTTFTKSMDFLQSYYDDRNVRSDKKNEIVKHIPNNLVSESQVESVPSNHCCRDMYILSHSASGGHLVRYFLDKCHTQYLRNIRAIAFTDSTHSIQWTKGTHQTYLYELLQSLPCIYFRCSSGTRDTIAGDGDRKWYLHPAGEVVQTDSFWRHRFGSIRTVWAGTNEHSQTNWYAHSKIWEHFDQFLFPEKYGKW